MTAYSPLTQGAKLNEPQLLAIASRWLWYSHLYSSLFHPKYAPSKGMEKQSPSYWFAGASSKDLSAFQSQWGRRGSGKMEMCLISAYLARICKQWLVSILDRKEFMPKLNWLHCSLLMHKHFSTAWMRTCALRGTHSPHPGKDEVCALMPLWYYLVYVLELSRHYVIVEFNLGHPERTVTLPWVYMCKLTIKNQSANMHECTEIRWRVSYLIEPAP